MTTGSETQPTGLTDDDRFDLQYAASVSERRNQPRMLVLGAAALLSLSLLGVLFGRGALSSAQADIARELSMESEIARLIAQLESGDEQSHTQIYEHDDRAKLNIQQATKSAGLSNVTKEPRSVVVRKPDGVQRIKFTYKDLKSPSIETLLSAVKASLDAVPGLVVMEIKLTSDGKEWSMDITYTRMERAN